MVHVKESEEPLGVLPVLRVRRRTKLLENGGKICGDVLVLVPSSKVKRLLLLLLLLLLRFCRSRLLLVHLSLRRRCRVFAVRKLLLPTVLLRALLALRHPPRRILLLLMYTAAAAMSPMALPVTLSVTLTMTLSRAVLRLPLSMNRVVIIRIAQLRMKLRLPLRQSVLRRRVLAFYHAVEVNVIRRTRTHVSHLGLTSTRLRRRFLLLLLRLRQTCFFGLVRQFGRSPRRVLTVVTGS